MSKFYDYIKSKENEIGKDFFCNIEVGKTEKEDKIIIYYRSFSFNKEEKENQKKEEGRVAKFLLNTGKKIGLDKFNSTIQLYVKAKKGELK